MLSFEEFFRKKKIDLVQLQQAEPILFSEFRYEFEQMGDKSFDHTKKFWFNKLRRSYHLKEESKPAKTTIEKNELATQAESLESPVIEQAILTDPETSTQKPAFKPRFRPGTIQSANPTETAPPAEKPAAYVPRFKPQLAKPKSGDKEITGSDTSAAATKPESILAGNEQLENPEQKKDPISAKPAYKPRFNMKTTAAKPDEKEAEAIKNIADAGQLVNDPEENKSDIEAKPAYKPRFNMKNIKPNSGD